MKSVEKLKIEARQTRYYRTASNYIYHLDWHVAELSMRVRSKEWEWEDCARLVRGNPNIEPYDLALKHMIHWGKADARIIEDAFGVSLPPSVHEFYTEIQEAVLVWRNIFHFLHPKDIVAWEKECRAACKHENLPVRLIRFCKLVTGDSVALRLNERSGKWSIVHAPVQTPTEEIQSPLYDDPEYQLSDDLDNWLLWLMQHDGLICQDERQWVERIG
ncbi:MAG: hypothetical protein HS117_11530 [Verrucomicrobiaceae bacterium]|nr:hypothetical protein [Verrucomicrobiaceae bacterium]